MVVCAGAKCSNSSRIKQMRFFKFPSEEIRRKKWLENSELEIDPGPYAKLCEVHFEESQFELHRQDGWRKLKPNAIPTVFPEPVESPKKQKEKPVSPRKRKRSASVDSVVSTKKKPNTRKRSLANQENSSIQKKKFRKKGCKSESQSTQKRKHGSENSQSSQKENVSPRQRKCGRPRKVITPEPVESSSEEEEDEESEDDEAQQQIALLKRENESMRQEIQEFEKHNKAMSKVILELEKHNKAMSYKLQELDKDNKIMSKKVHDLEIQNDDLRSKLNCCFSEEQLARMDKMRQLGKIERYIPAIK